VRRDALLGRSEVHHQGEPHPACSPSLGAPWAKNEAAAGGTDTGEESRSHNKAEKNAHPTA
jgi:hypothetical protein